MQNNKVVVFPFLGEFGWLVMNHARYVHQLRATEKVVCLQQGLGLEALYPTATSFKSIENPIPDGNRQTGGAYHYQHEYGAFCDRLHADLVAEYPGHEIIRHPEYGCPWHWSDLIHFMPAAEHKLLPVDVVLGVRHRGFDGRRNYEHWRTVAASLRAVGLRVGLAGLPETSLELDAADLRAWDHPDGGTAGCVDLLAHCRAYAGVDSGVSHLAALMQVPMAVLPPRPNTTPDMTGVMHRANKRYCALLSNTAWDDPAIMIGSILKTLSEAYQPISFYSQSGEDRWIVANLKLPKQGVFVEVGAGNGVDNSNTYAFERAGWTGLVIEPDPRRHESLRKQRRCRIDTSAIGSDSDARFGQAAHADYSGFGRGGAVIDVTIQPLGQVLDEHCIGEIDLLSVDTEGTELEVWRSFDARKHRPKIVIVEWNTVGLPDRRREIRDEITKAGYREVQDMGGNLIFVLEKR